MPHPANYRTAEQRAAEAARAEVREIYEEGSLRMDACLMLLTAVLPTLDETERERVLCCLAAASECSPHPAAGLAALYYAKACFRAADGSEQ